MDPKKRELNHKINMMYRQLGKMVHDDLNDDRLRVSKYKKYSAQVDELIKVINLMDVEMDGIEEEVYKEESFEPAITGEGYAIYKFCPKCNAGNHPEATRCVRCHVIFD